MPKKNRIGSNYAERRGEYSVHNFLQPTNL
jgi:hypothetical protein